MLKYRVREMRYLSRFLTVFLFCVPAISGVMAGPVATTAGSNLTGYNPSNSNNNQWATMTNARYDGNTSAKADFGNCTSLVLRCAQPRCGSGCTNVTIAEGVVEGCIKLNTSCKKYSNDLIKTLSAQLVATSNAKINEQQIAMEQARIQAEANAAAVAAANSAQSEQISQMQSQMAEMQNQMIAQQRESAQQLQEALAAQAAQSAAALENMKTAATESAQQTQANITSYQQEAINRGIDEEVLTRQTVVGEIRTYIEDAELSLKKMETAMQNAFKYADCNSRGDNCSAPKRVKKWRELANGFFDPYDDVITKIEDAIVDSELAGINMSEIYMMLNDSCKRWGKFVCEITDTTNERIDYTDGWPVVVVTKNITTGGQNETTTGGQNETITEKKKCTVVSYLEDNTAIYSELIQEEKTNGGKNIVIGCASNLVNNLTSLKGRGRKNNNAVIDIDTLELWLNQTDKNDTNGSKYCKVGTKGKEELKMKSLSRSLSITGDKLCADKDFNPTKANKQEDSCSYISPVFAICDTHPYNIGEIKLEDVKKETSKQEEMKEVIGLKITVVSQQMYKSYEYTSATLRRLKNLLNKAVLTANLEAAGAQSSGGASSGKGNADNAIFLSGAMNCSTILDFGLALNCISNNLNLISGFVSSSQKTNACLQLQETVKSFDTMAQYIGDKDDKVDFTACNSYKSVPNKKKCENENNKVDKMNDCINALRWAIMKANSIVEKDKYKIKRKKDDDN